MRPSLRGGKWKRVRTPGGRLVIRRVERKVNFVRCGLCGTILSGVPRERTHTFKGLAKTKKRPERMYGGVLCPSCLKKKIVEAVIKLNE